MMRPSVLVLAVSALLAGHLSPVTPEAIRAEPVAVAPAAAAGDFVWHDLVTTDAAAARTFYGALFGWTFEPGDGVDPGYTIVKHGKVPIGGIVVRRSTNGDGGPPQWLTYVKVNDVDGVAERFRHAGGRTVRGPVNARKDLRVAAVTDPQGAVIGLASRGPHVETTSASGLHEWLWMEYVAQDPDAALTFYADVLGYRSEISDKRENFTYYLLSTGRPRAGLFRSLWPREASAWLPYIRVEDPVAMAARVTELGGTVVIAPHPRVRNLSLTIVLDPSGAALALQKVPSQKGVTE
jgi:predicted enzyme related to lactoylglutathione lyase